MPLLLILNLWEECKIMSREQELLVIAWKLLNKQNKSSYVLNMLEQTVFYDNSECDGSCLMDDIEDILLENGIDISTLN